jgi:hypothetical protein
MYETKLTEVSIDDRCLVVDARADYAKLSEQELEAVYYQPW